MANFDPTQNSMAPVMQRNRINIHKNGGRRHYQYNNNQFMSQQQSQQSEQSQQQNSKRTNKIQPRRRPQHIHNPNKPILPKQSRPKHRRIRNRQNGNLKPQVVQRNRINQEINMAPAQPVAQQQQLQSMVNIAELTKKKEDDDVLNLPICMGCKETLGRDHTGTICVADHHICPECSKNYIKVILEEPQQNIPLKCMICTAQVIVNTFERQLTQEQAQLFLMYNMQFDPKYLASNEIIAACPFCPYFEVNTNDPGRLYFLCKKDDCLKSSCFWCKKAIKNRNDKQEDQKYDMDETAVQEHFECAKLAPLKQKWDKAIADGAVKPCPGCGLSGMKNNSCSQMSCGKCHTKWCYVCGLTEDKLDKHPGADNMFGHNINWKHNPKRCPMWLNQIVVVDPRWPEDNDDGPEKAVYFMHRLRTMRLLKQVIEELGDENYAALCKKYNVDKNCGFDIDEVMNGDHTLIKRTEIHHQDVGIQQAFMNMYDD